MTDADRPAEILALLKYWSDDSAPVPQPVRKLLVDTTDLLAAKDREILRLTIAYDGHHEALAAKDREIAELQQRGQECGEAYGRDTISLARERNAALAERDEAVAALAAMREALEVAAQAFLEFSHAQEVGPGWYTRGESGLRAQVSLWLGRGTKAVSAALVLPLPARARALLAVVEKAKLVAAFDILEESDGDYVHAMLDLQDAVAALAASPGAETTGEPT